MQGASECRAIARPRRPVSGWSPAAPDRAGTSSRPIPRAGQPAMLSRPARLDLPRRSCRPLPRRSRICSGQRIGVTQDVLAANTCRRAGRSGRQAPPSPYGTAFSEGSGSWSVLPGSSPITFTSPSSKARQKSGPFAAGITRPQRSNDPVQTPAMAAAFRDVEAATLAGDGSPLMTTNHLSNVPCLLPRRIERVRVSIASHARRSFPKWQEGQHPHCHFRGLLRLHTRYGPPDCSAAQGDLCREAPTQPVTQPSRSPASGFNRQLSGWNPPPLIIRAFGAHCQKETYESLREPTLSKKIAGLAYCRRQNRMGTGGGSEELLRESQS